MVLFTAAAFALGVIVGLVIGFFLGIGALVAFGRTPEAELPEGHPRRSDTD